MTATVPDRDTGYPVLLPNSLVGRSPAARLCLVRGRGAVVWDSAGRALIDTLAGLGQCAVGYGREELADAAAAQMRELMAYPLHAGPVNEPALLLARRLVALSPAPGSQVFFTSSGSEGTETALKLARLAHFHHGGRHRPYVLALEGSYHGATAGALAVTVRDEVHQGLGASSSRHTVRLTRPDPAVLGPDAVSHLVAELEGVIQRVGAEHIGAFIGEPIMGVAGNVVPPEGYWPAVRRVLDAHGILLVADEVATGYGRTGDWFASPGLGVEPDIVVTAKALTSGYVPMGAVLVGHRVLEMLDGFPLRHGFTASGHATAAAVALANLDIIEREALTVRAAETGARILSALRPLEELPWVRTVRGRGLMIAVELTDDPAVAERAREIPGRAAEAGVLVPRVAGLLRLTPPLVLTDGQAERVVDVVSAEVRRLGAARVPAAGPRTPCP
ncbi:aminotransferase class III-fold pyridoxal phosphate-dependent enzyme [Streptomyces sp. NPDC048606]|uniref:aminotransferase family protein n=1 Tax=Streptomyces sp. NPDC048606 TaxID=3154726 RepID=UPI00341C90CE